MSNLSSVPLEEYWLSLAYPDGEPKAISESCGGSSGKNAGDASDLRDKMRVLEEAAWDIVCEEVLGRKIRIFAFRWRVIDPSLTWYPSGLDTVREQIPLEFFLEPTKFGPGNPPVIYYSDSRKGSIFNAPWHWPIAVFDSEQRALTDPPRGRKGGVFKCDWELYRKRFLQKVDEIGYPDKNQERGWQRPADVIRWLEAEIISEREDVPAYSTVQRHVQEFMDEFNPNRK